MNIGFALEYSLGHATHADNLKRYVRSGTDHGVDKPLFLDLPYENTPIGALGKLPGVRSNWSLRASIAAYLGVRRHARGMDAALFHTQVVSLLSAGLMRDLPSIVSLDATPVQYDVLGAEYGHVPGKNASVERFKKRVNQRAFHAARHLVTWSQWTKNSLVEEYGIAADKITVIPPGIDLERWQRPARDNDSTTRELNLLFVGGDFHRKGGDTLMDAITHHVPADLPFHVHIVTRSPEVSTMSHPKVTFHTGLGPNSDTLRQLFATADIFAFPTRADCLPLAVLEAMASGLPVITTDIGALSEAVGHGEAGLVVPPDNAEALGREITTLCKSPELRRQLSLRGRQIAEERFDGAKNYGKLLALLSKVSKDSPRKARSL